MIIPRMLLKRLYTFSSLKNYSGGVQFSVKNRLSDATLTEIIQICIDDEQIPPDMITLNLPDNTHRSPTEISKNNPLEFPLRQTLEIRANIPPLAPGKYNLKFHFRSEPFGELKFDVEDSITDRDDGQVRIPRSMSDNYSPDIIRKRQEFVELNTGQKLEHIRQYSFDPHITAGNIENFTGVAQVPLGFAGPITINGEYANGSFMIPMATTEGTLVASYNRGMKLLNLCGGVTCSIIADAMQRAPVFVFEDARQGRDFARWVQENISAIREEAEGTSSIAKLQDIDTYLASKFVYLRFNYTTGDAAGQNMVGRATFAACSWIMDNHPNIQHFYLESNFATDKKASQINIMRTRWKTCYSRGVD